MPTSDPFLELVVTRISSAESVADTIREQLLKGSVQPGTRLSDQSLAASMGVSRNTIREAMTILASYGLVTKQLHRGVVVAELSFDELTDVYRARRALEVAGLRAGAKSNDSWLESVRVALKAMQEASAADDLAGLLDADTEFHRALVAPIGSERIDRVYRNLQTELRLTSAWYGEREEGRSFYRRHRRIVTAIEGNDIGRAEELVIELIDAGESRLRKHLK